MSWPWLGQTHIPYPPHLPPPPNLHQGPVPAPPPPFPVVPFDGPAPFAPPPFQNFPPPPPHSLQHFNPNFTSYINDNLPSYTPHRRNPTHAQLRRDRDPRRARHRAQNRIPECAPQPQSAPRPTKQSTHGRERGDANPRDLATCQETFRRLGVSLPGYSKEEIERWIAERKRNWPSRANVARKLAEEAKREKAGDLVRGHAKRKARPVAEAMAKLAEYGSSDEEVVVKKDTAKLTRNKGSQNLKCGDKAKPGKRIRKNRQRRKGKGKEKQGGAAEPGQKRTLLRMLLEKEIRQEHGILLQAFRYLVEKQKSDSQASAVDNKR